MYNIKQTKIFGDKIKGIIFGDCGTLIDPGSKVPILSMMKVFSDNCVPIHKKEVKRFYGMTNRVHISALLSTPEISKRWYNEKNVYPTGKDVDNLTKRLLTEQKILLNMNGSTIPSVLNMCNTLFQNDIKIGISSILPTEVVKYALELNPTLNNFVDYYVGLDNFKSSVTGIEKLMEKMEIEYPHEIIKVDSHREGLLEGSRVGCWVAGVPKYGYKMGFSDLETIKVSGYLPHLYDQKTKDAYNSISGMGTHYVMDDIVNIMDIVRDIENIYLNKLKK